ncbi:MAG: hypothetical protein HY447_04790 [Candidatus Omnitrophica bacterium]|nr:hypothetical protein [Candidatus Omnitrophota bacterium]
MIRTVLYGILLGVLGYAILLWKRMAKSPFPHSKPSSKINQRYRSRNLKEPWVQVYETASQEDARLIQMRLQEEEVECLLYEQGKKDIYGNPLQGIGIAVPKSSVPLAQKIISRMPV